MPDSTFVALEIPNQLRRAVRHPLAAAVILLFVYGGLSLLMNPDGYLGSDTGAKIATLETMTRNATADPDVGYWAADLDPTGVLHPLYQAQPREDGGWVAVSTLPVLELARPLYAVGGYRATLLLPMLGGVGVAFAAAALARRIGATDGGWSAFWLAGLGSPVVVYALDFWEHTIGLACTLGAVALLVDVATGRGAARAIGAGVLLGASAVLRNETLVYALVAVGTACVLVSWRSRSLRRALVPGVASAVGFLGPWVANRVLEAAVGAPTSLTRSHRVTGTAEAAGSDSELRVREALQTLVGFNRGGFWEGVLLGGCVVALVLLALWAERRQDRRLVLAAVAAVVAIYVLALTEGLGFIPGMLVAFPIAIAGWVLGIHRREARPVAWVAVAALPLVYYFQYTGGAAPQWGGRYTLTSALLLGVVGSVGLRDRAPRVAMVLAAGSFAVSALGVAWLGVRSHGVDRFFDDVVESAEPVVVSRNAFLIREGGTVSVGRRWLSVADEAGFLDAIEVVRAEGDRRFSVLEWGAAAPPPHLVPSDVREVRRVPLMFVDVPVGLVTYEFTG